MIDLGRIIQPPLACTGRKMITGHDAFKSLKESGLIDRCFNLRDGASMAVYEYCYSVLKGVRVFLWKSVVSDGRNLFVPVIQNGRGQPPIIYWWWLEYQIDPEHLGMMEP